VPWRPVVYEQLCALDRGACHRRHQVAFTRGGQRHDVDAIQAVLALQNDRYVEYACTSRIFAGVLM
jgi:hypothetical protein